MRRLAALTLFSSLLAGLVCTDNAISRSAVADTGKAELSASVPRNAPMGQPETGLLNLDLEGASRALLYVPATIARGKRVPVLVMLHGARGRPEHAIELVRAHADRLGLIVLAPSSRGPSWDIISDRRYGRDVRSMDRALSHLFSTYPVDPARIAIGGFSDGASYALSVGITNGQIFTDVLAFSPGFVAATRYQGRPRIFVSHGVRDRVLPIDATSRRFVPQLRKAGFQVDYREFSQGHTVPERLLSEAMDGLAS